jgi:hypothetical protein
MHTLPIIQVTLLMLALEYLKITSTNSSKHWVIRRMVSSGMLHRVALVRTDISEKLSASFIRVTRIGEQGTTLAVN